MMLNKELLENLRKDKKLKQSAVANLIGTTQQQYSKYETGESELPLRALAILADYYDVSADYLMGRTDCKQGVFALNQKVRGEYTTGALISDVLSFNAEGRDAVIDYISLQKQRFNCTCGKKKEDVSN
jgi:transcriptional regulator with XRE-family HTH domain